MGSTRPTVRPEFAAVVFGGTGLVVLLAGIGQVDTLYEYLALAAWCGSCFFVAVRGFWAEGRDAFAEFHSSVSLVPPLLALTGIVAWAGGEDLPGLFLILVGVFWTAASPVWRRLWSSRPVRIIGDAISVLYLVIVIAIIGAIIYAWLT